MSVRLFCLTMARFTLAAWVGGAILFVINGVRLVTSGAFGSVERDHISLIRFPPYYLFGFVLVGTALACLLTAPPFRWRRVAAGLVAAALLGMLIDYFWVYLPLAQMITPPGRARSSQFIQWHQFSEVINTIHVGLCLVAGLIACYARPSEPVT